MRTIAEAQPAWIQAQVASEERPEHPPNKDKGSQVLLQVQTVGLRPFDCGVNKAHDLCKLRAGRVQLHAPEVDLVAGQLGQRERGW